MHPVSTPQQVPVSIGKCRNRPYGATWRCTLTYVISSDARELTKASYAGTKNSPDQGLPLTGKRVLLVEDEYYIADDVRRTLMAEGATVAGPYATLAKAHQALDDDQFDCAVIDLNLQGESAIPIADRLAQEGKPFALATGYGSSAVPDRFEGVPRIEKPFDPPALLNVVGQLTCPRADNPTAA